MKVVLIILSIAINYGSAFAQNWNEKNTQLVGGPCEGCEAIFGYGDKILNNVDTLPDFNTSEIKLKVMGTIYQKDGITPAADIILYVYQTDKNGIYATREGDTFWAKRHGYRRGWIRTDKDGKYTFYTLNPGHYPDREAPAHIHLTVLEPTGKYYWLGAYHFNGDEYLTDKEIKPKSPRGGSPGLLELYSKGNLWVGRRDIILGKNISDYDN